MPEAKNNKVFLFSDYEGVLVGRNGIRLVDNKYVPYDRTLNVYITNGINALVNNGYDVEFSINSTACGASNPILLPTIKNIIGGDKNILQHLGTHGDGMEENGKNIKSIYGSTQFNWWNEQCKNKVWWVDNPSGIRYHKGVMAYFMMKYYRDILKLDIKGSHLYFIDNDSKHLNTFDNSTVQDGFKELGVTAHTIGVDRYIDKYGYTQACDAGGKGSIQEIETCKDFADKIVGIVQNKQGVSEAQTNEHEALNDHYNKNPQNLNFDNIGGNEYGQIGIPSKPKEESKKDRPCSLQEEERNLSNLLPDFKNVVPAEKGYLERLKCGKSNNNKVGVIVN